MTQPRLMKKYFVSLAVVLAIGVPSLASAQETSPDGSEAFGFEPYFAVMGGYESFDRRTAGSGIPNRATGSYKSGVVDGIVGANIPLGPLFVGAEGNVAKGFSGDIDWEYGVAGRVGFRAGESGMIYGKAGYQWVNFRNKTGLGNKDFGAVTYGLGVEVGPKEIGLGGVTGRSGVRIRLEASTYDFNSIRPSVGIVAHF